MRSERCSVFGKLWHLLRVAQLNTIDPIQGLRDQSFIVATQYPLYTYSPVSDVRKSNTPSGNVVSSFWLNDLLVGLHSWLWISDPHSSAHDSVLILSPRAQPNWYCKSTCCAMQNAFLSLHCGYLAALWWFSLYQDFPTQPKQRVQL